MAEVEKIRNIGQENAKLQCRGCKIGVCRWVF